MTLGKRIKNGSRKNLLHFNPVTDKGGGCRNFISVFGKMNKAEHKDYTHTRVIL